MANATLRRIVALAFARTARTRLQSIAAPGLLAPVLTEHAHHRPGI
jgi:hypothetical protein